MDCSVLSLGAGHISLLIYILGLLLLVGLISLQLHPVSCRTGTTLYG